MCRNWLAILFLVLLSSSVSRSTARETKEITCTGKVMDSKARPLAGAEVAAYEKFYNYSSGQEYTKILGQIIKTNASGHFVINADINSQRNVFIVARKKGLALGWDCFDVSTSEESHGIFNIILEPPCVLAGTVVDETGNPVVGAGVRVLPKTSYLSRLRQRPILEPQQWFTTKTDAKGNFSFNNLAPDVIADFWVDAPGKASIYKYTTHYTSSCGFEAGRSNIRLVLPSEIKIQGRIIDKKTGDPIVGVGVLIQPNNIREHNNPYCPHQAFSALDGQFSFEGIPAGKHLLKVLSPEKEIAKWVGKYVEVDVKPTQAVKDITVEIEKGEIIETVVREGTTKKPLHNIRVSAYSESSSGQAWTNVEGVARIRVPTGEYKVYTSAQQYSYYRSDKPILVTKDQNTELEILLDRKLGGSGIVLDESARPIAGALIRAHPFGDEVLTDATGRFEVGFDQRRPCKYLFARYVERNFAAIVEVKDDSGPIKATLRPALSIVGQVTDANGVGIPAARLSLCVHVTNCLSKFGCEVLADARGRYQMTAVPPQQEGFDYRISVNASGYETKEYERISIMGEPGTFVEMKTIALQPADQSISGIVVDAEGKPAAGVPIFLHGVPGSIDQPEKTTATDNNGRFTINRICKGPLRLQANFGSSPGGSGFMQAEGGDRDIKIILGQEGVHRPHVSLVDKPLPDLKDLKIEIPAADTDDKMLLVCFFDMQQRPSRNCIMRLAKKAQELKAKDIVVVVVQSSQISENKLNEWIKKYNIPFTVGAITTDIEKTRFAWGVRSLPWLILTDQQHIIHAEGFSLTELDEKISAITQR
ncbi:MAG: redoxin domain-containing protein [Planctomycetes bacterium]|nr:redoxin domain-containing protein [Planctomycetota bacterium]